MFIKISFPQTVTKVFEAFQQWFKKLTQSRQKEKDPIERWQTVKERISLFCSVIGCEILNDDYKPHLFSYFFIFDVITYIIINGYDFYLFWGDFLRVCFCTVTWSFGYQVAFRFYILVTKQKMISKLYEKQFNFMQEIEKEGDMTANVVNSLDILIHKRNLPRQCSFVLESCQLLIPYLSTG